MRRALAILAALALATAALAQQAPLPPIEISAEEQKQIEDYLGQQPFKISEPLMNFLRGKQRAAQEAARRAAESKGKPE